MPTDLGGGSGHLARPLPDGIVPEAMVVRTEKRWSYVVMAVLGVIVLVIVATGILNNLHPPSSAETIDPTAVYQSPEFSESNLGATRDETGGGVTVHMIAQQYSFTPACVSVPAGTHVVIRVTSADVIHGFIVAGTNVNAMVVPGYISRVVTSFGHEGTYRMPCHEYCGFGHSGMAAVFKVVSAGEWDRLEAPRKGRCDAQ